MSRRAAPRLAPVVPIFAGPREWRGAQARERRAAKAEAAARRECARGANACVRVLRKTKICCPNHAAKACLLAAAALADKYDLDVDELTESFRRSLREIQRSGL